MTKQANDPNYRVRLTVSHGSSATEKKLVSSNPPAGSLTTSSGLQFIYITDRLSCATV